MLKTQLCFLENLSEEDWFSTDNMEVAGKMLSKIMQKVILYTKCISHSPIQLY